jgi:UDP-N-acetylglucosamine:LPS N-acetylglucosamine transferase
VVGWPDLAENLSSKLDGRAIAGLPVDIVPLDADGLAAERNDFTVLFLGGTGGSTETNSEVQQAVDRWNRKANKSALIITDGGRISGFDLILRRRKVGDEPQLCIVQDTEGLAAKGMTLPAPFLQKLCP